MEEVKAYRSDLQDLADLVGDYDFIYIRQKVRLLHALRYLRSCAVVNLCYDIRFLSSSSSLLI